MLSSLSLYHFKNYTERQFSFTEKIACFHGKNGTGKTNILDAIYYLCFTKSYFSSYDSQVIQQGKEGMFVKGLIQQNAINCIIRENGNKEISLNSSRYEKNSEHIGRFPAVMISPDDIILINGHSDTRRRFVDILLCQLDANYLHRLVQYNKYLAQRNALLKSAKRKAIDATIHNHYKEQLAIHASYIFNARKKIIEELIPICENFYQNISSNKEKISISYKSQLSEQDMNELLTESEEKDFVTQRTNVGIHKDDLLFTIHDSLFKQSASQGQKKSFLFAIKLAEFSLLEDKLNLSPILLLDDLFEKLDSERSQLLVDLIVSIDAQTFITDTDEERLRKAFMNKKSVQFESIITE